MSRKTVWTKSKVNKLREMLDAGIGTTAIAKKLKVGISSVSQKKQELGYPISFKVVWSKKEDDLLIEYVNEGLDDTTIAIELGRSEETIVKRKEFLGCLNPNCTNYYDTTYNYIIYQCKKQKSIKIAAIVLDLSEKTIKKRLAEAEKLGYIKRSELKELLA